MGDETVQVDRAVWSNLWSGFVAENMKKYRRGLRGNMLSSRKCKGKIYSVLQMETKKGSS